METTTTLQEPMTLVQPQPVHEWLQKMVGEWTYEITGTEASDQPAETMTGTETVRSVGGFWVIAEGQGQMCSDADEMTSIMTLGYNPQTRRYVGTWVGSMMAHLWVYDGELDAAGQVLTLISEGPAMTGDGTTQYKDTITFESDNHRVMTSHMMGANGQWQWFMTAHYRRQC
jgi:hypothetical protein